MSDFGNMFSIFKELQIQMTYKALTLKDSPVLIDNSLFFGAEIEIIFVR